MRLPRFLLFLKRNFQLLKFSLRPKRKKKWKIKSLMLILMEISSNREWYDLLIPWPASLLANDPYLFLDVILPGQVRRFKLLLPTLLLLNIKSTLSAVLNCSIYHELRQNCLQRFERLFSFFSVFFLTILVSGIIHEDTNIKINRSRITTNHWGLQLPVLWARRLT